MNNLLSRIVGKYHRSLAYGLNRRLMSINTSVPIISFTFDDAPKSAFVKGGEILGTCGIKATYFVSLGLLNEETEVGANASEQDLRRAVKEGNELGCHTFDHYDTWKTSTDEFVKSVERNKQALGRMIPEIKFKTFAYPIGVPRPAVKARLKEYFKCCRGGGQAPNVGMADLNLLKAYFIDKRNNVEIGPIKKMIDYNMSTCGWLIFATHDITENHSPYGCSPKYFEEVVNYADRSGALILPVGEACEKLEILC